MLEEEDRKIAVLDVFNEKPKQLLFRQDLTYTCVALFIVPSVLIGLFLGQYILGLTIGVWLAAGWAFVAKDDPYVFISKFVSLPGFSYFIEPTLFVPAIDKGSFQKKLKHKSKPKTLNVNGKKAKLMPFQNESNLHALMEIEVGSDKFVLYLKHDKKHWSATIPLKTASMHTEVFDDDANAYAKQIVRVLKDIPYKQKISFMMGCRSKCDRRKEHLKELRNKNKLGLVDLIIASDSYRTEEITGKGLRQEWSRYTYLSWEQQFQDITDSSEVTKLTNFLSNFIQNKVITLAGNKDSQDYDIYTKIARDVYENTYLPWMSTLEDKGKLEPAPLSEKEAWKHLWYQYNSDPSLDPPQVIRVKKYRGEYICNIDLADFYNPKDAFSVLFEGSKGRSNCPRFDGRDSVKVNGEYVATMILKSPDTDGMLPIEQLNQVWSKLSDFSIRDTEFYVEATSIDNKTVKSNLKKITKQATYEKKDAVVKGKGADVDAVFRQNNALEAQERLRSGGNMLSIAVVVLVYRKSYEELHRACNRLNRLFSPARLVRDEETCLQTWLETQLFNNKKMLGSYNFIASRTYNLDSYSALRVLPLTMPHTLHERGVELITEEGGVPIHLDILEKNERLIILGSSGSGKSILGSSFLTYALAREAKVAIVDMSSNGDSTYKPYVLSLGRHGSYINLVEDRYFNILQPPNVVHLPRKIQKQRIDLWKEKLLTILIEIVMGQSDSNSIRYRRVEAILVILLKTFFNDQEINERINKAFKEGWQSEAWQSMPVLKDLLFYCSIGQLNMEYNEADDEAAKFIVNQIESKLNDPNIGKAIGNVSNVPPSPAVTMFALSGLSNESNSYVMALVAQMASFNICMESSSSLAIYDEVTELIKLPGFARIIANGFSRGRKQGLSIVLIGQDIGTIAKSSVKDQIVENTNYWLIGNIQNSSSPEDYVSLLGLPLRALSPNKSWSLKPSKKTMSSSFLLKQKAGHRYWRTIYYSSAMTLATTANSQDERAARARVLSRFPKTTKGVFQGLSLFAKLLYQTFSSGKSVKTIGIDTNEQNSEKHYARHDRDRIRYGEY